MKLNASADVSTSRLRQEAERSRQRAIQAALDALAEQQRSSRSSRDPADAVPPPNGASAIAPES